MSEAQCPQCGAPITQDFGVVTCAACGTVLMVDFDGNIQRMESGEGNTPLENPQIQPPDDDSSQVPVAESYSTDYSNSVEMVSETNPPPETDLAASLPTESEYHDIFEDPPPTSTASGVSDVLSDIQNFANSDLPTAPLTYTVVIEEIDRRDLNKQLWEILSDQKFQIDVPETMKRMKNGRLELMGLNAVKASILVLRLRSLPLKISWKQHAYEN